MSELTSSSLKGGSPVTARLRTFSFPNSSLPWGIEFRLSFSLRTVPVCRGTWFWRAFNPSFKAGGLTSSMRCTTLTDVDSPGRVWSLGSCP